MLEEVNITVNGTKIKTSGLTKFGNSEFCVDACLLELVDEGVDYLTMLARDISTSDLRVEDDGSAAIGYWPCVYILDEDGCLSAFEHDFDRDDVRWGLAKALGIRKDQRETCARFGAIYDPVTALDHAIISAGVKEGYPTHGSRYSGGDGRSGWYLYTDLYNGDVSTMQWYHLYHITDAQPRLAKFLALPLAYRFYVDDEKQNAYFDQEISDQETAEPS